MMGIFVEYICLGMDFQFLCMSLCNSRPAWGCGSGGLVKLILNVYIHSFALLSTSVL